MHRALTVTTRKSYRMVHAICLHRTYANPKPQTPQDLQYGDTPESFDSAKDVPRTDYSVR